MQWINLLPNMFRTDGVISRVVYKPREKLMLVGFSYQNERGVQQGGLIRFNSVLGVNAGEFAMDTKLLCEKGLLYEQIVNQEPSTFSFKRYMFFNGTPQFLKIDAENYELLDLNFEIF